MPQLQPEQANFLLHNVFISALKNEHDLTKKIFGAIPLDKGNYRPDDVSRTAMELAWHIVMAEMRFLDAIAAGEFNFAPRPQPETIKNSADLGVWYAENFESRLNQLLKVPDEALVKIVDFRGMFQLPAVMYVGFILHHTVHHRGQLSTYLRPMGAKVPSIYGESYDAAEARKAAQTQ